MSFEHISISLHFTFVHSHAASSRLLRLEKSSVLKNEFALGRGEGWWRKKNVEIKLWRWWVLVTDWKFQFLQWHVIYALKHVNKRRRWSMNIIKIEIKHKILVSIFLGNLAWLRRKLEQPAFVYFLCKLYENQSTDIVDCCFRETQIFRALLFLYANIFSGGKAN